MCLICPLAVIFMPIVGKLAIFVVLFDFHVKNGIHVKKVLPFTFYLKALVFSKISP